MKPTLWESVFCYENVCLEDYPVHTTGNLLHKIYIVFKTEHMEQDNRGHKKWQMCHWSWKMWLRYIFSKCKDVKQKKMKVHLRHVDTWYSCILKAWLELNLLTNIKFKFIKWITLSLIWWLFVNQFILTFNSSYIRIFNMTNI